MKKLFLVLIASLLSAPASAQLSNLPPNTVVGRIGAGTSGPAQAIPFSTLGSLLPPVSGGGGGGGGGALNITRVQIPATNTGGTSFILTGYATVNDRGSGAPMTCSGQTANSVGAIQDKMGTWCAFDIARVAAMDGFEDGWFGAKADGVTDDTAAIQASYDAAYNAGLANAFCTVSAASRVTSYPLYFDPPGSMRGGAVWTPQFDFSPSSTGGYQPGAIITSVTLGVAPFYANNDSTGYWGFPGSPDATGYGTDTSFQIVSSTASVAYNPSWTAALNSGIVIASFKGTGVIGTPNPLVVSGPAISQGAPVTTTGSAPGSSLIVVVVQDIGGNGLTGVTDNATGGPNSYVNAVSVDNPTLGGIYIFYSTTGHALPAGGHITVTNGVGSAYSIIAYSVTNASGGLDRAAFVDNTSNPLTNPTVSTGALSQANEVVFGALVSGSQRITQGWTEPAGWTSATTSLWSPGAWNAGTTYNAGDHVIYEGIPWQSLQGSNINHIPQNDLGANFASVWWQPITLTASRNATSDGAYLHGSLFYGPGSFKHGCIIQPTFNNSAALIMPPGTGVVLSDVEIEGPSGATRCGNPTAGIGVAEFGVGAGANRVKYVNVTAQNFYYNLAFGLATIQNPNGGAGLGAENHIYTPVTGNGCYGTFITGTQSFINSITDATLTDDNTEVFTGATVGVKITGGNYSHENGPFAAAKFTMSAVSASFTPNVGYSFTATVATPSDPYMTQTCSNTPINSSNLPKFPDPRCSVNVYNTFLLKSSVYGIVPFVMTSFNRSTSAATFWTLYSWFAAFGGQCCGTGAGSLVSDINGQTSIWAAEMTRKFVGNSINVDDIHIEDVAPFQLVDTNVQFGANDPVTLRHIKFNSDYTMCNAYTPGVASTEAMCFAQQEFPWINVGQGDVLIDSAVNTVLGSIGGESNMVDFSSSQFPPGGHLTVRNWTFGQFNYRIQPFTEASNSFNQGNQGNLSGNYQGYGSAAFGQGDFEMAPMTGANQAVSGPQLGAWTENAWLTRTQGLNRSPFLGTRPAPWSTPCISPLELVKATTYLPAIYLDGSNNWQVNYALLSSGQQYKICDWNLTPTAWSNSVNYYPGSLVTNAGTTYVNMAGDANQLANRAQTPGTPQNFTASIASTTMTVTAVTGSVLVHAPITSGAAAGTTIIQQLTGSAGSTGTYQVEPSQTVGSSTLTATYWASLGATFHYGAVSNHVAGYSYGQDITTTNNAGLAWTVTNNSPFVQLTGGRNGIYFPGLVIGLTGTQGGCGAQQNFVIRGVHGLLGYLDTFLLDSDVNGNIVPAFGAALCGNTVIKQAPYSVTNLN